MTPVFDSQVLQTGTKFQSLVFLCLISLMGFCSCFDFLFTENKLLLRKNGIVYDFFDSFGN